MIYTIFILIPFMVTLISLPQMLTKKRKTDLEKYFVVQMIIFCLIFLSDFFFTSSRTDYNALVVLNIVAQYLTLGMVSMLFILLRALNGKYSSPFLMLVLAIPGAMMGTASLMLFSIVGIDNAAAFFDAIDKDHGAFPTEFDQTIYHTLSFVSTTLYDTITIIAFLILVGYIIYLLVKNKFRFSDFNDVLKGENRNPSATISFLVALILIFGIIRISLGRNYLIGHQQVAAALSFSFAVLLYLIIWIFWAYANSHRKELLEREAALEAVRLKPLGDKRSSDGGNVQSGKLIGAPEVPANDDKKARLLQQFVEYMDKYQPFLNPNLSIDDVADGLKTNRTYISVICNQYYNLAFRDYINRRRIEYAKQKIAEDPNELMDNIATMSGYLSASQFNRKFKEIEGVTPRNWMFNHIRK